MWVAAVSSFFTNAANGWPLPLHAGMMRVVPGAAHQIAGRGRVTLARVEAVSRTESKATLFAELAELRAQLARSQQELAMLRQAAAEVQRDLRLQTEQSEAAPTATAQTSPALSTCGAEPQGGQQTTTGYDEQAAVLRSILDSMGEGVAVVDAQGKFVLFNRVAQEIIGLGPVPVAHEQWPAQYGLYLPDQTTPYPAEDLPLVKAMRGEPVREVAVFVRNEKRPDGLWLRVTATPLRDAHGQVCGGVAVFRDVTDVTQAQQALEAERLALHHMVQAQERDRRLTAYEIHDGFVQQVVAALLHLEASGLAESAEHQHVQAAAGLLRSAIEEARRLINGLRPPLLDELGLVAAVEHLVSSLTRPDGPHVELEHQVAFDRLDPLIEGAVFRMVQEALSNAYKHSGSQRLAVRIVQQEERLFVEVIDWGRGFDATRIPADRFGLRGIKERARLFGGSVRLESAQGKGTRLLIELPLAAWAQRGPAGPSPVEEQP